MNSTGRLIFISLLTLALALGLGYEIHMLSQIKVDIASAELQAENKIGSDSRARDIAATEQNYKDDIASVNSAALTTDDIAGLADTIEKGGRGLGLNVTISSITDDSSKSSSASSTNVSMTINSDGPWTPSISFVKLLENIPHKVSLDSISLRTAGDSGWNIVATIRFMVSKTK